MSANRKRGRSFVFWSTNALAGAAFYFAAVEPWLALVRDQRTRIEQSLLALRQGQAAIAESAALSSQDADEAAVAARRFIQGENGLVSANLLTKLRQTADHHGVSFTSIATLPAREWFGRRLVGARIEFTGSTQRAAEFLLALERDDTFLFVRRAKLNVQKEDEDSLATMLEIYGMSSWRDA